jgi:hypothetical protein
LAKRIEKKKLKWSLREIRIEAITSLKINPRRISVDDFKSLKQSIDIYGLIDKPIVNTDYTCIAGHQRLRVLALQDYESVECWVPDRMLTPREVKELCIRMNRNQGEFDYDILSNEFDVKDLIDWGFLEKDLQIVVEGEELEDEKVHKKSTITVSFSDELDMQNAENEIREIAERNRGRVKVKL